MINDYRISLGVMIDNSSLSNVEKRLAKEKLKLMADIDLADFAKSKAEIQKQIQSLAGEMSKILKGVLDDKTLGKVTLQWAKELYTTVQNTAKEQAKINAKKQADADREVLRLKKEQYEYEQKKIQLQGQGAAQKSGYADQQALIRGYQEAIEYEQRELQYQNLRKQYMAEGVAQAKQYAQQQRQIATETQKINMSSKLKNFLSSNTAMPQSSIDKVKEWIRTLESVDDLTRDDFNRLKNQFTQLNSSLRQSGQLGMSVGDSIKAQASKFAQWFTVSGAIMRGVNTIRKMKDEVIECDSAMTELAKVSDASASEIKNYFDDASVSAKKLGSSISDVIRATADFSRLGYNLQDSKELAEVATLYKNVGDGIDIDGASDALVSSMAAFNIEAKNALSIVDAYNEVSNNFAIDSKGIGEGLQRSASSLAVAGNTMAESIGLLTAGNTVVRDVDSVGTALKTTSLRLTSTKAQLSDLNEETDYACETFSEYRDLLLGLTHGKVNIIGDSGEYKNTFTILKEISGVWEEMNSMEQNAAMNAMFGKRQANIGASIIENFDIAQNAMKTAENSAGSAMREQEKYSESIQYSLDKLSASFQELSNSLINSDFLKGLIDGLNTFTNVINNTVNGIGIFGTALAGFTTASFIKTLIAQILSLGTSFEALGVSAGIAGETLLSFFATNPLGWVLLAGTAITGLVKLYDKLNVSMEENLEIVSEKRSEYDDASSSVSQLEKELKTIDDRIKEINANNGAKVTRDGELENLQLQSAELLTQLNIEKERKRISGLDAENSAVDTLRSKNESKYDAEKRYSDLFGMSYVHPERTMSQELNRTIDEYSSITEEYGELLSKQEKLANDNKGDSKQYKKNEKELASLSLEMDNTRKYALTLAEGIQECDDSLVGATEDGNDLKNENKEILKSYVDWVNKISGVVEESDKLSDAVNNVTASTDKQKNATATLTDDQTKALKTYETRVKSLKDAMGDISNVSIVDLMQDFSTYDWSEYTSGEKDLQSVLRELSELSLDEASKSISGFDTVLKELYDETFDFEAQLSSIGSEYENLNDVLSRIKSGDSFSRDEIERLINLYPTLADKITEVSGKYLLEEDSITSLLNASVSSYNKILSQSEQTTKGIIEQAKKRIETYKAEKQAYIQSVRLMADNTVKINTKGTYKSADEMGSYSQDSLRSVLGEDLYSQYSDAAYDLEDINELYSVYNKAEKDLDKLLSNSYKKVESSKSGTGSSAGGTIDYARQSIEILSKSVEDAERVFENTKGYGDQIKAIENLISAQNKLKIGYKESADTYKKQYDKSISGLTKSQISDITSGKEFRIEDYGNNENLYKKLTEAQEWFNTWQEQLSNIDQITYTINDNVTQKADLKFKKTSEIFDNSIKEINDVLSEIDRYSDLFEEGSMEQISLLQTGYQQASKSAKSYNEEIKKLNKQYANGKISEENYTTRLDELTLGLYSASDAMNSYGNSIENAMKTKLDNDVKSLEETEERISSELENQLSKYKEITDEKKKALKIAKETHEYEKDIAEQNKSIAKITNRISELQNAINSGDTSASVEYRKLQEELAKEQEALQEKQYDHEIDLQESALDTSYESFEKMINDEIDANKLEYDAKIKNIQSLYETEKNLIIEAANLTSTEFTKSFDTIKQTVSDNFMNISKSFVSAFTGAGKTATTTSKVASILSGANKEKSADDLSALNKYLSSKGYGVIDTVQMVSLAQALGLEDITSKDMVGKDSSGRKNKNRILEELKKAGFSDGGTANINTSSNISKYMRKITGEDGIALVRNGEKLMSPEMFKKFEEMLNMQPKISQLVGLNTSGIGSGATNNSIKIGNIMNIEHVDKDVDLNQLTSMVSKKVDTTIKNYLKIR